jgi:hypothetical protein
MTVATTRVMAAAMSGTYTQSGQDPLPDNQLFAKTTADMTPGITISQSGSCDRLSADVASSLS